MRRTFVLAAAAAAAVLPGCSEPTTDVSGTVTRGGKPVPGLTVTFFTPNNKTVNAGTDEDGKYAARVVGSGTVHVTVQAPPPRPAARPDPPAKRRDTFARGEAKGDDAGKMARVADASELPPPRVVLPPRYNDPKASGLSFEADGAAKTFDIDLK